MFGKIVKSLQHVGAGSSFQSYYGEIQLKHQGNGPTRDEAQQDFRNSIRSRWQI